MRQVRGVYFILGGIIMRKGFPASRQKGSLSLWMICKTREELFLILQLYYRLNWMKSRIRLADVG